MNKQTINLVLKIDDTTKEYWLLLPETKYFIIRWLKSGGYHLFPIKDYEIPHAFNTKREAKEYINKWKLNGETKIVKGDKAFLYPIPMRY